MGVWECGPEEGRPVLCKVGPSNGWYVLGVVLANFRPLPFPSRPVTLLAGRALVTLLVGHVGGWWVTSHTAGRSPLLSGVVQTYCWLSRRRLAGCRNCDIVLTSELPVQPWPAPCFPD